MENKEESCVLCALDPKNILKNLEFCTVVASPFADKWPGALMVVAKEHVKEVTDFSFQISASTFEVCFHIELQMREKLEPLKINWAQFGNAVPHLHWHLVPRYEWEKSPSKSVWELLSEKWIPNQLCLQKSEEFYKTLKCGCRNRE